MGFLFPLRESKLSKVLFYTYHCLVWCAAAPFVSLVCSGASEATPLASISMFGLVWFGSVLSGESL